MTESNKKSTQATIRGFNRALHTISPGIVFGVSLIYTYFGSNNIVSNSIGGIMGSIAANKQVEEFFHHDLPLPKRLNDINAVKNDFVNEFPILKSAEIILKTSVGAMVAPVIMGLASGSVDLLASIDRRDPVTLVALLCTILLGLDLGTRITNKIVPPLNEWAVPAWDVMLQLMGYTKKEEEKYKKDHAKPNE